MSDAIVVFMTAGNVGEARRIGDHLVESHLAACVQILPGIESIYRWQGEVRRDQEVLMLAKTSRERFEELEKSVRAIHSYDTPEIVAVSMAEISEPYRSWLNDNVGKAT